MQITPTQFKLIIGAVALTFVAVAAIAIATTVDRSSKIATTVTIFPRNATATANGAKLTTSGTTYLKAGTYEVKVQAEGFSTDTQQVVVDKTRHSIAVLLPAQSDSAKTYVKQHAKEQLETEGAVGYRSRQQADVIFASNDILKHLPVVDKYFSIGYVAGEGDKIIVTVNTASPTYRYYAIRQIQDWGYDVTDLAIRFTDYHNPLTPVAGGGLDE